MRTDLPEDPAVIRMSSLLKMPRDQIVGILHRLWSWADTVTPNGNVHGVTVKLVDRHMRVPGLTKALLKVGWLELLKDPDGGIRFPHFDRHMGSTAKKRALGALRARKYRPAPNVTEALPEKRRDEKSKKNPPPAPLGKGGLFSPCSENEQREKSASVPAELRVAVLKLFYPSGVPRRQQRRVELLVCDLAGLSATPEELRRRVKHWSEVYKTPCRLSALVSRWDAVEPPPPNPYTQLGQEELARGRQ